MKAFDWEGEARVEINKPIYSPVWCDSMLTDEQIVELIAIGERSSLAPAQVGDGSNGAFDGAVRRTMVSWIDQTTSPHWFAKRIEQIFCEINSQHFAWHLTGAEPAQYTKYESSVQGEYKWHCDTVQLDPQSVRKLSCSILLSDPAEYEGGNLILAPQGAPITVGDRKGRAVFFPSWTPHCVTPVVKGVRRSLVLWAHGPAFK